MNIEIKGIGPIEKASIDLLGITVVAAVNDSGKSTTGRALYSSLKAMSNYKRDFIQYKKAQFQKLLTTIYERIENNLPTSLNGQYYFNEHLQEGYEDLTSYFQSCVDVFLSNVTFDPYKNLEQAPCFSNIEKIYRGVELHVKEDDRTILDESFLKIYSVNKLEFEEVSYLMINSYFKKEFEENLKNFFYNGRPEIEIIENENKIFSIKFDDENEEGKITALKNSQVKDIFYIDNPFILDNMGPYHRIMERTPGVSTRGLDLLKALITKPSFNSKLILNLQLNEEEEEINIEDKEEFLAKINEIVGGEFAYKRSHFRSELKFFREGKMISLSNLAAGIKSFAILELLVKNNDLGSQTLLIIDEPEIHLHPKWQVYYADLIMLLSKKMKIKFLISTHSTYFIEALNVMSLKYNTKSDMKYYILEEGNIGTISTDVTENIDIIYEKLNYAFRMIDEIQIDNFSEDD